jgi:uncharacterized membrane protein YraQ (UPF0718 family)
MIIRGFARVRDPTEGGNVSEVVGAIRHALSLAAAMGWEILWALILGFMLSAIIQSVVSKHQMVRLLPDDSPRTIAIASGLGAASSSCSYAAVALSRSIFRKGGNFTAAMAFEFASTNLVIELGVIMAVLLGWQFTLAEFIGGPIMIIFLAVLFRLFLRAGLVDDARMYADRGALGRMEGHASMDMSLEGGTLWSRIISSRGFTAISHFYVMDWASIYTDIILGLVIAGSLAAWVPETFWQDFFLVDHPLVSKIWGPIVGPIVAIFSFVCSIGNVPLAAVLWNGGISFGGVISFIFADLIVLPILNIYRKYYGWRMAGFLFVTFYLTMVAAGYVIEILFGVLGLIPDHRNAKVLEATISWNYTTVLNLIFLAVSLVLAIRFLTTGGRGMMRMMKSPSMEGHGDIDGGEHSHHHH